MWLSKQTARSSKKTSETPLCGTVTLSGPETAVYTDAERRGLSVRAPGGYFWRPKITDEVLVIKEGEQGYVIADLPKKPPAIGPGELLLKTGLSSMRLCPDGLIEIEGIRVTFNGTLLCGVEDDEEEG